MVLYVEEVFIQHIVSVLLASQTKKAAGPQGLRRLGIYCPDAWLTNHFELFAPLGRISNFLLPALIAAWAAARRAMGTRNGEQLT